MSDHNWVLENLESYHGGGLNSAERERLEAHLAKCAACSKALQEMRGMDDRLDGLFAPIRPEPGLEDRMIRSLRIGGSAKNFRLPLIGWIGLSAAAAVLLGILGAGMEYLVRHGSLGFGEDRIVAANNLKQIGLAEHEFHDPQYFPSSVKSEEATGKSGEGRNGEGWSYRQHIPGASAVFADASVHGVRYGIDPETFKALGNISDPDEMASRLRDETIAMVDGDKPVAFSADGRQSGLGGKDSLRKWDYQLYDDNGNPNGSMGFDAAEYQKGNPETRGGQHKEKIPAIAGVTDGTSQTMRIGENRPFGAAGQKQQQPGDQPQQQLGGGFGGGFSGNRGGGPNRTMAQAPAATAPPDQLAAGAAPVPEAHWKKTVKGALKPSEQAAAEVHTYRNDAVAAQSNEYFRPGEQAKADVERLLKELDQKIRTQTVTKRTSSVDPSGAGFGLQPENKAKEEQKPAKPAPSEPAAPRKIVIRSGDIEFEVDSFDSAVATVTLLVNKIQGGFVATVNSEKLPNGKVRGSVVVRVPPEHLDGLVLELRKELGKAGELKGQKIGSQDITKQYTDLESRLKAARAMEERLLQIIKTGKGEIKDLLAAEKELGVWRTKIEEFEGELRYYANQVALSTLTITLAEKEIRSPFAVIETERVQMGVEVEDVIKAQQQVLKAVEEAKGRVTKSELKQHAADQLRAVIHFEVTPESAGPLRDRIEQLGRRTRLDIDRLQETEGGTGKPEAVKTRRKDTQFFLDMFNVANIAPRETVHLKLACVDTEDTYKKILTRVETAKGRVVTSNLNRQRNDQTSGLIQFEVKSADAGAVLLALKELGEVMRLQVTENPDVQNVTRSKQGFNVELLALGMVQARETTCIQLATRDVPAGYRAIQDAVTKAKGQISVAQLNEQNKQNITAQLDFEIRRADEAAVAAAMAAAGDIFSRNVTRAADADNVVDSKVRWQVALINQDHIPPREITILGIEVANVDKTAAEFAELVTASKGRTVESHIARERSGRMTAKLIFTVPLSAASTLVDKFKSGNTVRVQQFSKNPQVPESELAVARLDVTLSNSPLIVPSDEGFGPELRKGLSTSVKVLSLSLSWLLFGLMVVLPWAVVIYVIYRVVMKLRGRPSPATGT